MAVAPLTSNPVRIMEMTYSDERWPDLEQFRHFLFHLQMEFGSVHPILDFLQENGREEEFETLKNLDPNLMTQLLAREYVLDSKKAESPAAAQMSLELALELDPYCPDAFFELAQRSDSPEAAMNWFDKCLKAVENLLGQPRMAELKAAFQKHPWHQPELHLWMKAKASLAEKLFQNGYFAVAKIHFSELLALNPSDDLNLSCYIFCCHLCEGNLLEAAQFCRTHRGNPSAAYYYGRAFLRFQEEGDTRRSRRALSRAFQRNIWVGIYLLGLEKMPASTMPVKGDRAPRLGSRKEAVDCVKCIAPVFCQDPKLSWWAWEALKNMHERQLSE